MAHILAPYIAFDCRQHLLGKGIYLQVLIGKGRNRFLQMTVERLCMGTPGILAPLRYSGLQPRMTTVWWLQWLAL